MVCRSPRCILLLLLSALSILDHSVEASSYQDDQWAEPHDDTWIEQVARNRRFLTRKGRESLHNTLEVRNRRLPEEELQQYSNNNDNDNDNDNDKNNNNNNQSRGQDRRDLAMGTNPSVPVLNVLVVLLQWTNHPNRNTAVPKEDYEAMLNNQGRDADLYPG